ncbi:MAG TPA: ABC transporter permease [Candidatus Caldiarchaeum subterraneum]|uniref:ABC transporter permease n=1 Tax=Caldiarchaeum subterraneum TaxID=311458 RepID=A0A832ZVJ1_CALS0|nr:ABC transporter permease [Candidatus Caldarchaeum subterraneum]
MSLSNSWRVFISSNVSKVGIMFLIVIIGASVYVLATYPADFGKRYWNDPTYWADYPKGAPPAWIKYLAGDNPPEHIILFMKEPSSREVYQQGLYASIYTAEFTYNYDDFPSFLSLTMYNITYYNKPPLVIASLTRPGDEEVVFFIFYIPSTPSGENPPYRVFYENPRRVFLSGEAAVWQEVSRFLNDRYGIVLSPSEVGKVGVEKILFGEPVGDVFRLLKGRYVVRVAFIHSDERDTVSYVKFVMGGKVYGLAGTDSLGRDLAVGLLFGFPVALLIGVLTSTLTTTVGATLGIVSGYTGGRTDEAIQRVTDVINNIPLLPILIFLVFILKPSIWLIISILIAFGWPGLTIVVRSMVLQLRSSQLVEAEIALGASRWRIMFRHILPQIAPFIFAQMIFTTPAAILAEAALSFLGLGDPSIPTWGQILDYGFRSGGIYTGYWWWIVPPGLLIVFTSLTFVLLALGLEPVINPRLRSVKK